MVPKVLIIGGGITGGLCASAVQKAMPLASVTVWDKARGAGGRMTTTRSDSGNKADLGAQYITTSKETLQQFEEEYQPLLSEGLLQPLSAQVEGLKAFPSGTSHFVAPDGLSSVVKHFLSQSGASVSFNKHVSSVAQEADLYKVETKDGTIETFNVVISTMPIPQLLALPGSGALLNDDIVENLKKVEYSTRFVLIWFYNKTSALPQLNWASKYLDDEVFRYVTLDNVKRNQHQEPTTVVFHTSIQFGAKNISKGKADVEDELMARAKKLFPDWPTPDGGKCHKWLFSQVQTVYPEAPGCVTVTTNPTLILAGDAFSVSNFNGCIASARAAVNAVVAAK